MRRVSEASLAILREGELTLQEGEMAMQNLLAGLRGERLSYGVKCIGKTNERTRHS